jgi:hypothetical protein
MKKQISLLFILAIASIGVACHAQVALEAFPLGTTQMTYRIEIDTENPEERELMTVELSVTSHGDDLYTVEIASRQTATKDEFGAEAIGMIFGATSVTLEDDDGVDYSPLQALIAQRDKLQEGQSYMLPSGTEFTEIVGVTVAGVFCLEGSYIDPNNANRRVAVAFALSQPTFIAPRLREQELRDGVWVTTFILELTDYSFIEEEN